MPKHPDGQGVSAWMANVARLPVSIQTRTMALYDFVRELVPYKMYCEDKNQEQLRVCTADTLSREGKIYVVINQRELLVPTCRNKLRYPSVFNAYSNPKAWYGKGAIVLHLEHDGTFLDSHVDDVYRLIRDAYKLAS